jgi:uncharacterized protein
MDWLLKEYWPWWLAALGMGLVTVGLWIIERRPLGVSGSFTRAVSRTPPADPPPVLFPIVQKPPLPRTVHLTFMVAMALGGFLSMMAATGGEVHTTWKMGPTFAKLIGDGVTFPALLVGGVLVGIGARMAGGCTSGHGLSGCSRMTPNSLVSTMTFFGTAIVVSLILAGVR